MSTLVRATIAYEIPARASSDFPPISDEDSDNVLVTFHVLGDLDSQSGRLMARRALEFLQVKPGNCCMPGRKLIQIWRPI